MSTVQAYASTLGHTRVILDGSVASGSVTRDGRFLIPSVEPGTYILSVVSHNHQFDKFRIDIPTQSSTPEVRAYAPGTPLNPPSSIKLSYPILITPRGQNAYFVPPQSFNLLGMFQNPMMLMMVFGGVMMLSMPYLLKSMDPEMVQEFKENQAKLSNFQTSLQNGDLKSSYSALMSGEEPRAVVSTVAAKQPNSAPNTPKNRGNKKRR
ncbi:hypothetical protein HETIRDRAFT_99784 [Heterobasidion irregulare TC 32-1]|uniref:ER membrane protein complex subunit 7 beta-sandwich domain-containing protein n=1 Tax=Heterobasidion irregulare (strain TC 32-1) TaxID=747525 RepID=W4KP07_HETIT|nr:uncharacterized protein HETIRDRAFT_99784 [Heterobasidion irregulare TC 32-1]ETW87434.1 hypothetical protein HETIRDRAFT_99784 [Heterobasidion irregulare TC 32-1]